MALIVNVALPVASTGAAPGSTPLTGNETSSVAFVGSTSGVTTGDSMPHRAATEVPAAYRTSLSPHVGERAGPGASGGGTSSSTGPAT